ncbi:MAG: cytochrome c biogenesis protein CcsA [Myxococcota bacterium]|nr:cytochrome c biogenesis protein CcsA [Myxococcota bacterium]
MSLPAPANGLERFLSRSRGPLGIVVALLLVVYAWAVYDAPLDSVQGIIQNNLYVHPPLAYGAYLGFIFTGIGGAIYLWKEREEWDRFAISGAEVGCLFCALMMITGPIWAKGTWGKWWSWDPRLTVTLLLFFVYLAYLMLRNFADGGARTARFAAVYGIVGVLLIPLNYFVIEIFDNRSIHPENLERGSLGDGMGFPFLMGNLALFAVFVLLFVVRFEVETLRARASLRAAGEIP